MSDRPRRTPLRGIYRLLSRIVDPRRRLTLNQRIAWLTGFAVALGVLVTGSAAYLTVRYTTFSQIDAELIAVAGKADQVVLTDGIIDLIDLDGPTLQSAGIIIEVVDAQATYYQADQRLNLNLTASERAVARLGAGQSVRTGTASDGSSYRIVAIPVTQRPGTAVVAARPLAAVDQALTTLLVVLMVFGVLAAGLSAAVGAAVARQSLRPVRDLTRSVEYITATNDLTPVEVIGSDEVSRLARSFNTLLNSVASSRDQQRQLIADAGHELRTPLTSLRANVELLSIESERILVGEKPMIPANERAEILLAVNAQLAEFSSLVTDLVQLAREDRLQPPPEPIDFRDVIQDAVDRVKLRGPGLNWDVELEPLYLMGEPDTLERAVTNLLDNAVKWSPPGGTIRVHLEGDRLRIADEGPGIAPADLPHIFDRFYRSDSSRNTPGTGLGLSIVAATVERHGGWVRAGRSAPGGAEFTMSLPGKSTEAEAATEEIPVVSDNGDPPPLTVQ